MKLRYIVALVACASLSVGVAGVTVWQGGITNAERVASVLVGVALAWVMVSVKRDERYRLTCGAMPHDVRHEQ